VTFPIRAENPRGVALKRRLGLAETYDAEKRTHAFVWQRAG
jgi:hypothetical protein